MAKADPNSKTVSENRKARFNYFIESRTEAGIVLTGSEVKSLRLGHANIAEAYASETKGELWLYNAHISPLAAANRLNHEPLRPRKILLKRREMDKLTSAVNRSGYTLVPLELYWKNGRAKLAVGLAKGKKQHDKRAVEKDRDWQRDKARALRRG